MHVSLGDSSVFASKGMLGVYFSANEISSNDVFFLPFIPQVIVSPDSFITEKEEWIQFDLEYRAIGGEEYMTIGNFNDSNVVDTAFVGGGDQLFYENTYYYIDDVYLGNCDSIIGLPEINLKDQISIYPNPVQNDLNLEYKGSEKLEFRIFNVIGQVQQVEINQSRN